MKKYELTTETNVVFGRTLYRIRAVVAFGLVEKGEVGGWIEREANLAQDGDAWVCGNAWVYGNAKVCGDAKVYGNAEVCGDAKVYGNAKVCGDAEVYGNAKVCGDAEVCGNAEVYGNAKVCGNAVVYGNAKVCGDAEVKKATHLFQIGAIGSRYGFTTFVRSKGNKILVVCGCFRGTIGEFENRVKEVHSGTKHEKTYLAAIELAKMQVEDVEV